jgi:RNA polymerase sigma-70 factor (ECF subfamily)
MENPNAFEPNGRPTSRTDASSPQPGVAREADLFSPATLAQAREGDRDALDALLGAVRPRLLAVALRMMRDRDDAEDVVQDAMMKVCRHLGRFEGRAALSTWLHRIVVNTALDRLRGEASRPGHTARQGAPEPRPEREVADDETPEAQLSRAEVAGAVRGAMSALSPAHRQVLALRELDGESYRSIAAAARCPVGTVMSRLHHARKRLTEALEQAGPELLAA